MVKIILYGNIEDKKITKSLINNLEGKYNITYQTPYKITSYIVKNLNNDILIIETDTLKFIESSNTIVLFKNSINQDIDLKIENNTKIIVFSQNSKAINFLSKSKLQNIITFGYRSTDSITASSFNDTKKIICLQRQIKSISNKIIDPFEFCVKETGNLLTILPVYGLMTLLDYDMTNYQFIT